MDSTIHPTGTGLRTIQDFFSSPYIIKWKKRFRFYFWSSRISLFIFTGYWSVFLLFSRFLSSGRLWHLWSCFRREFYHLAVGTAGNPLFYLFSISHLLFSFEMPWVLLYLFSLQQETEITVRKCRFCPEWLMAVLQLNIQLVVFYIKCTEYVFIYTIYMQYYYIQ